MQYHVRLLLLTCTPVVNDEYIANMQRQPMQGLLLHRPRALLPPMHPVHPVVHGQHQHHHGAATPVLAFLGQILLKPHRIPRTTGWCFLIQTWGCFFLCGLFAFKDVACFCEWSERCNVQFDVPVTIQAIQGQPLLEGYGQEGT